MQHAVRAIARAAVAPASWRATAALMAPRRGAAVASAARVEAKPTAPAAAPPAPALPVYDVKAVKDVVVGVPGETAAGERRVAGTPESVATVRDVAVGGVRRAGRLRDRTASPPSPHDFRSHRSW